MRGSTSSRETLHQSNRQAIPRVRGSARRLTSNASVIHLPDMLGGCVYRSDAFSPPEFWTVGFRGQGVYAQIQISCAQLTSRCLQKRLARFPNRSGSTGVPAARQLAGPPQIFSFRSSITFFSACLLPTAERRGQLHQISPTVKIDSALLLRLKVQLSS